MTQTEVCPSWIYCERRIAWHTNVSHSSNEKFIISSIMRSSAYWFSSQTAVSYNLNMRSSPLWWSTLHYSFLGALFLLLMIMGQEGGAFCGLINTSVITSTHVSATKPVTFAERRTRLSRRWVKRRELWCWRAPISPIPILVLAVRMVSIWESLSVITTNWRWQC